MFIVREQNTFHAHFGDVHAPGLHGQDGEPEPAEDGQDRAAARWRWHREFHCPCHGSKYYGDGTNYAGPAPKPLACFRIEVWRRRTGN